VHARLMTKLAAIRDGKELPKPPEDPKK